MSLSRKLFPIVILAGLVFICNAQDEQVPASETPATPYIGQIIGSDVYVRSGPGTAYYFCSKLSSPAEVTVVEDKYGWSKIIPPEGSFSWISTSYVKVDPARPGIGIVTGDSVRIWAGSDFEVPMRSSSLQTKLNTGDIVTLLPNETENETYYKIAPPPGAYLWVSSQFIKYARPVVKAEPTDLPPAPQPPIISTESQAVPVVQQDTTPQPTPTPAAANVTTPITKPVVVQGSTEAQLIEKCRQFDDIISAELAKPLNQQNYGEIKKQLKQILDSPQADKAKLYAQYQIDRIERYELARVVTSELAKQQQQLDQVMGKIQSKYESELAKIGRPKDEYAATGKLEQSNIFTAPPLKRYIIKATDGSITCYATPATAKSESDCRKLIGKTVALKGEITSDPSSPVSLVSFTEITEFKE